MTNHMTMFKRRLQNNKGKNITPMRPKTKTTLLKTRRAQTSHTQTDQATSQQKKISQKKDKRAKTNFKTSPITAGHHSVLSARLSTPFRTVSSACLVFFAQQAAAIQPVETMTLPKEGWSGQISAALDGATGNTRSRETALSALTRHRRGEHIILTIADYNEGKVFDTQTADDLSLHVRWIALNAFATRLDQELFVQWSSDDFQDLRSRGLIGYGARWRTQLLESDAPTAQSDSAKLEGIFGLSSFYETESRESLDQTTHKWRLNLYTQFVWEGQLGDQPLKSWASLYVQPAYEAPSDVRGLLSTGISLPISKHLALSFNLEAKHDAKPFSNVKRTNTDYQIKLTYKL